MPIPEPYQRMYPWLTESLWAAVYDLSIVMNRPYDQILLAMEQLRRPLLPTWCELASRLFDQEL